MDCTHGVAMLCMYTRRLSGRSGHRNLDRARDFGGTLEVIAGI